jgi:RNA polymerase sigma-70 factor (ECF subfamily)
VFQLRRKEKVLNNLQPVSRDLRGSEQDTRPDVGILLTHLNAAYNFARWLVRDESEAEDMVQNAYLRAISHFGSFRGGDGRTWLLTIVRNVCYDRLRHKRRSLNQNTELDESVHIGGRLLADPETTLLEAERNEFLQESLAGLPTEYREVLVLRELEQLTYLEIADIANIPVGTVMSRLSRGRQRLHEALSGYGLAAGPGPGPAAQTNGRS